MGDRIRQLLAETFELQTTMVLVQNVRQGDEQASCL